MTSYKYTKLEKSIEDVDFEYVSNLDDYKAMLHILSVLANEKLKLPELVGIFNKMVKVLKDSIARFSKITKGENLIDIDKLKVLSSDQSFKKIILVKNEEYNSFASYKSGYEENDKMQKKSASTVYYNVGQLETSGSVSIVPSNANVFLSSMLYTYTLLFGDKFYERQTTDVFVNIAKMVYTIILSSFGKKSGLLVGARMEKEYLFFLTASLIFSIYAKDSIKTSKHLESFLKASATQTGSAYFREYSHKVTNSGTVKVEDPFDPNNYDSFLKYTKICQSMKLLEISESDLKIQIFRLLGLYGILSFENYPRFVAYMLSTHIPNSYFTSTLKVYNKSSYQYLVEFYLKEMFTIS